MTETKAEIHPSVQVAKDIASVGRAMERLARHLDAETDTASHAFLNLLAIGPYAVGPLTAVLRRPGSTQRKLRIVRLLVLLSDRERVAVGFALLECVKREKDPLVRQYAASAQSGLIARDLDQLCNRPGSTERNPVQET